MSELKPLTAEDVFLALIAELDHPSGYVTKDPMSLSSVTVDGTIGCDSIAEFLNQRLGLPSEVKRWAIIYLANQKEGMLWKP